MITWGHWIIEYVCCYSERMFLYSLALSLSFILHCCSNAGPIKRSVRILDAVRVPWLHFRDEHSSAKSQRQGPTQPDISLLLYVFLCEIGQGKSHPVMPETPASAFQLIMSCLAAAGMAFLETHHYIQLRTGTHR